MSAQITQDTPFMDAEGNFLLPPLDYPYEALEPHIDAATMHLHHDLHHKGYVDGLNKALKKLEEARTAGDFALVKHWSRELSFHGSGHYLHMLFWKNMAPKAGGEPTGPLAAQIQKDFGSYTAFVSHFSAAANAVEGSGWAILGLHAVGKRLRIEMLEKHQNLSVQGILPLLVLDVWEHAYYLKYQNRRAEYTKAFWNVVNWRDVEARFAAMVG